MPRKIFSPGQRGKEAKVPKISEEQALEIAWNYVKEHQLPVGQLLRTEHQPSNSIHFPKDQDFGLWCIVFASLEPPDPPNVVSTPAPDMPFYVDVNDQTGDASMFERL